MTVAAPQHQYALLINSGGTNDLMENELKPVENELKPLTRNGQIRSDSEKGDSAAAQEYKALLRDGHTHETATQTAHGRMITVPGLHIPGRTGELAGLAESGSDVTDSSDSLAVTPEKLKKMYMQVKVQKLKYKLILFASVASMLLIVYSAVLFPWFVPYFHTVVFPSLYILRAFVYTKRNWHLYCLDFCYCVNTALLIYCWAFARSELLFGIVFGAAGGPVAVSLVLFRNSLVFHDYDRMTSVYIHLMPSVMTYIIRWFPSETSLNWYFNADGHHVFGDIPMYSNETEIYLQRLPDWVDARWLWIVVVPLVWYIVHMVICMFIENCCFNNKKYVSLFRWLTGDNKTTIYSILTLCGRIEAKKKANVSWIVFCLIYGLLSFLGARLCYEFFIAHSIYLLLSLLVIIYNGASFYIEVFADRGLGVVND